VSKELKLTASDFYTTDDLISEAVLDANDPIQELKQLSGMERLGNQGRLQEYTGDGSVSTEGSNVSKTAMEKVDYQNNNNIQPGTPEWFRLWFTKPFLTNTTPFDIR
jgi:hypothetical protein